MIEHGGARLQALPSLLRTHEPRRSLVEPVSSMKKMPGYAKFTHVQGSIQFSCGRSLDITPQIFEGQGQAVQVQMLH